MTALDLTTPVCVVVLAFLLLLWGGYVLPGSYVPRFSTTLDVGHGVVIRCPHLRCCAALPLGPYRSSGLSKR